MRHIENWLALSPFLDSHHIHGDRERTPHTAHSIHITHSLHSPHKRMIQRAKYVYSLLNRCTYVSAYHNLQHANNEKSKKIEYEKKVLEICVCANYGIKMKKQIISFY